MGDVYNVLYRVWLNAKFPAYLGVCLPISYLSYDLLLTWC